MVQINFARKEINCKLVFYGPGLSGKTTNLEKVHERTPEKNKGELTSISTDGDRTLFFDFMPLDLGEIAGMKTKFHLYTVPGQVYYNSTRKLVLLGADGVIFVADSSRAHLDDNKESLENLRENLAEMGKDIAKFPLVLQWNKRDVEDAMPVEELERELNTFGVPSFEAIAFKGEGVFQTLKALSALVLKNINSNDPASRAGANAINAEEITDTPPGVPDAPGPAAIDAPPPAAAPAGSAPPAPQAAPAPGGGLQIERNEVGAAPPSEAVPVVAAHQAPGNQAPPAPQAAPPAPAPQAAPPAPAPQVAQAPQPAATTVEAPAQPARGRDEVMAAQMNKHAAPAPATENTLRREVKVIGSPAGSRSGGGGGAAVFVGVLVVAAGLAAAWYFFV